LLRRQARQPRPQPLVVFTPKSLLRLKAAAGYLHELTSGAFQPVIDDPRFLEAVAEVAAPILRDRTKIERVLVCSGKIYYDLIGDPGYEKMTKTAIVRVELLSPLPVREILDALEAYPNLRRVIWVQEEPMNMGARAHVRRRIVKRLPNGIAEVEYVGRPYRASPSEGYGGAHAVEQERIVREALDESR
jgi:2-oxoglutarate dehydrogenase E1 component